MKHVFWLIAMSLGNDHPVDLPQHYPTRAICNEAAHWRMSQMYAVKGINLDVMETMKMVCHEVRK